MVEGRSNAIPDLPRCYVARLEQEPRRRSQHSLALRRCHGPKSHLVENEIELAWYRQGYVSASKAPSFVRVVTALPSCASCVTMLPSAETRRDSQAMHLTQ
jgi:hypothetical protein